MRTLFCGTENDIKSGIAQIEAFYDYYYINYEYNTSPDIRFIESISDYYKDSDLKPLNEKVSQKFLLIVRKNVEVDQLRIEIDQKSVYNLEQFGSPYVNLFLPGGLMRNESLMAGWLYTNLSNSCSVEMFRYFSRTLRRGFKRIGNYWFGPEALQLVAEGIKFIPVE